MFFKNSIDIEARLTKTPEVKTSANGTVYCRFGIAHNQSRKNKKTGEWSNVAHFFNCVTFGKMAENCANFEKGNPVSIRGILQYSKYEKDGETKSDISILVNDMKKLDIPKKSDTNSTSHYKKKKNTEEEDTPKPIEEFNPLNDEFPDEVPF